MLNLSQLQKQLEYFSKIPAWDPQTECLVAVRKYRNATIFCDACAPGFHYCVALPLCIIPEKMRDTAAKKGFLRPSDRLCDDTFFLFSDVGLAVPSTIGTIPHEANFKWTIGVLVLDKPYHKDEPCFGFRFLSDEEPRLLCTETD